jgi:hypothetical protein
MSVVDDELLRFVMVEIGATLFILMTLLIIIILQLLEKQVVTVTVVSVKTDAASYDHNVVVNISGDVNVDETPQANTPVNLKITDSAGMEFPLPDATTNEDGKFTAVWTIPPEVAPGVCTLTATALGATVTTTFTSKKLV